MVVHAPAVTPTVLSEALRLGGRGFRVVFLHAPTPDGCTCGIATCDSSRGKHPILNAWQRNASSDADTIHDQYRRASSQIDGEPNLGIVLGTFGERYAIAIDVDDEERLIALSEEHGALPATLTGHSARGARMFFVLPPDAQLDRIKNITSLGGTPGVDVKVKGGQVAVAPSRHLSGTVYSWMDPGAEVAELPAAWLLAIYQKPALPKWANTYTPTSLRSDAKAQRKAKRYLEGAVHSEAALVARSGEGGRNSALHHAACAMFCLVQGLCLGAEHGWVVRELSNAAKSAGLPELEVRRTIASAEKWQQETGNVRVPHIVAEPFVEPVGELASTSNPTSATENDIKLIEDSGKPAPIAENVARMLVRHPRAPMRYDAFADRVYLSDGRPLADHDLSAIEGWLFEQPVSQRVRARKLTVRDGIVAFARAKEVHPVREYLLGLVWDRVDRLDVLFTKYFGALDTALVRGAARCFLIGAVARVMVPGCQLDTMPVLEGEQGIRKSTAVRTLAGDAWFSDTPIPDKAPDCYQQLRGVWLYELAELASIKGRDIERVKAFISQRVDHYRTSYGYAVEDVPRQVAFVGTTNAATYLADETGNRRYHPIPCGQIDLSGLRSDRDMLWAEAFHRWRVGEPWWLSADLEKVQATEVSKRAVQDPWADAVAALEVGVDGISARDILVRFGLEVGRQTKADEMRIAAILKRAGWRSERIERLGVRTRFWFRPQGREGWAGVES